MDKVIPFQIQPSGFGAIRKHFMTVRCRGCGNTEKFYGRAITHPFIVIEQSEHNSYQYEVTEVGYTNNGQVEEVIDTCANCGSHDIDIQIIKRDVK